MSLLTAAPMTAAEVARELGLTHANASYHLRTQLAGGLIVVDGEETAVTPEGAPTLRAALRLALAGQALPEGDRLLGDGDAEVEGQRRAA